MKSYHEKIMKCFIKSLHPAICKPVLEVKLIKPKITSVSFHCHGKELAVTVTGENLWFCNRIKVGSHTQSVNAEYISQKSLQFNVEDKQLFTGTADHINVRLWSHFSSPVTNSKAEVKHKVINWAH